MTARNVAYFFAFLFLGLSLGASLAHLFALPNKIALDQPAYFIAQGAYRGWAFLGLAVVGALFSTLVLAITVREDARIFAVVAFVCLVGAQVLFWTYTFPANQATENWTVAPADWEHLRRQWEFSHAAGAVLNLVAMTAVVLSVLAWG
jgi:hypothetical protein